MLLQLTLDGSGLMITLLPGTSMQGGGGDGEQCLLPLLAAPLSASLNSPSGSCRAPQQVTCVNDAIRLGSGERPMWVPMRARHPFP